LTAAAPPAPPSPAPNAGLATTRGSCLLSTLCCRRRRSRRGLSAGGAGRAEERVGQDERRLAALRVELQAQEVAPARQVSNRVALDEVLVVLVHERAEGDDVQLAVG
jgi:hypothetical protein